MSDLSRDAQRGADQDVSPQLAAVAEAFGKMLAATGFTGCWVIIDPITQRSVVGSEHRLNTVNAIAAMQGGIAALRQIEAQHRPTIVPATRLPQ